MASIPSIHTVRIVAGHIRRALVPSPRQAIVEIAVELAAILLHVRFVAHVLVEVIVHVAFAVAGRRSA